MTNEHYELWRKANREHDEDVLYRNQEKIVEIIYDYLWVTNSDSDYIKQIANGIFDEIAKSMQ